MSDLLRLKDKLAKLNASGERTSVHGREIRAAGKDGMRLAFLQEIDETILARELTFQNEGGVTLKIQAASRRLLRLSDYSSKEGSSVYDGYLKQNASNNDLPFVDAIAPVLCEFLDKTSRLRVHSKNLTDGGDPSDIGCSPGELAQFWSLELYENPQSKQVVQIESLIKIYGDKVLAWVRFDSAGIKDQSGRKDVLARLTEYCKADFSKLDRLLDNGFPGSVGDIRIVGSGFQQDQSVIYVKSAKGQAALVVPADQLSDCLSAVSGTV